MDLFRSIFCSIFMCEMWAKAGRMGFWRDQFIICTNMAAAPLWIAGLVSFLRDRRYRMLGWMYVLPLALFFFGKGRGYYLAAAYPMLFAMGAVVGERWIASLKRGWRLTVEGVFFAGLGCVWGLCILHPCAAGFERAFAGVCHEEQWRSAGGDWVGADGEDGGGDS